MIIQLRRLARDTISVIWGAIVRKLRMYAALGDECIFFCWRHDLVGLWPPQRKHHTVPPTTLLTQLKAYWLHNEPQMIHIIMWPLKTFNHGLIGGEKWEMMGLCMNEAWLFKVKYW